MTLLEHFLDKHFAYIVMEKCSGGELMQRIQQDNGFSERVAANYFRQMLAALQHCHGRLVVHRYS